MEILITSQNWVEIEGKVRPLPKKLLNYGYQIIKTDGTVIASANGWTNPHRAEEEANKKLKTILL
ncbi:hypothetical protein [Dendronalium phyllosphericum]|nr:hypothetical protein [Dendronalium phyllosphericum]